MSQLDTAAYLDRLGRPEVARPDLPTLRALHAAHVERVTYEALDIQLGRMTSVDPHEAADRMLRHRRGGYCYHLNGAFSLLLAELGYDVVWHQAGVQTRGHAEPPGADVANHLALTVHGLPADDSPSGDWLVDVGLGDALHEPLPLREGVYRQGPFQYRMRPSEVEPGGWRFDHHERGAFFGMDFRPTPATPDDVAQRHVYNSTSPDSSFVRTCTVQRRDAHGVDRLTGRMLHRLGATDGNGSTHGRGSATGDVTARTIDSRTEWFEVLADVFDLPLTDVDAGARAALWDRVSVAHETWLAEQAESTSA